jgi:hypothetical protein
MIRRINERVKKRHDVLAGPGIGINEFSGRDLLWIYVYVNDTIFS